MDNINVKDFQYGDTADRVYYGRLVHEMMNLLSNGHNTPSLFDLQESIKELLGVESLSENAMRRIKAGYLLYTGELPKCPFCGQIPTVGTDKEFVVCGPACPIGDRWIEIEDWCARDPEGTEGLYIL